MCVRERERKKERETECDRERNQQLDEDIAITLVINYLEIIILCKVLRICRMY